MRDQVVERLKRAARELVERYGDRVVAVGLFGSVARGEATPRSDVDVIVVVDGWGRSLERRREIYDVLWRHLRRDVTLVDVDRDVVEELLRGERNLTTTMLNILYDCVIVYDGRGLLSQLVESVRDYVKQRGWVRYRVGRSYGWRLSLIHI